MNIKTKIFTFTFVAALTLLPAACVQAEDKPATLNVSKIIPITNSQSITKTEDSNPNITSTIGWKNENGAWYYYKSDNTKAIGWIKPDNNWYYLKEDDGTMATGWLFYGNNWYYIDNSGTMTTGWKLISNKWYFFNSSGIMATGIQSDGSDLYYFTDSGILSTASGWTKINNKMYYADNDGKIKTGWLKDKDNGNWYFLQGDGSMITGLYNIDNKTYMFNDNGSMATGWININNYWYYFNAGGDMATGWVSLGSQKYYLYDTGAMATGWISLGNQKYYLYDTGIMATGWISLDGTWYYLNNDGSMATGWFSSDGSDYYYLDPATGKMLTNTTIDGYTLGADGKRHKATVTSIPLSTSSQSSDTNMKKIYASVNSAAKKYGLDSKLILAIIKAESNFDPNATSSSGAAGLMQIIPSNFTYVGITNGYDIDQNINGGSKLLKDYLNEFNGDVQMAVAAYNAGPESVKNDGVSSDADLYKMSQGVQDYVKTVMNYYKNSDIATSGGNLIET